MRDVRSRGSGDSGDGRRSHRSAQGRRTAVLGSEQLAVALQASSRQRQEEGRAGSTLNGVRSLLCRSCGVSFTQSGRGRNAYACPKCRSESKGARQAKPKRPKRPKRTYSEWVAQLRSNSKHGFHCEHCGKHCIRRPGGSNNAHGYATRWCGMDCRKAAADRLKSEVLFLYGLARAHRVSVAAAAAEQRRAMRDAYLRRALVVSCKGCGVAFEQRTWLGSPKTRCPRCEAEARRKWIRVSRAARRARERKAGRDRIDPIRVFERDRWRCHICHRLAPRRLRGTHDERAPELDHIVPLAAGGSHTWGNVACACRACNIRKGAMPLGQLGLAITV